MNLINQDNGLLSLPECIWDKKKQNQFYSPAHLLNQKSSTTKFVLAISGIKLIVLKIVNFM